jgi:Holliday junction resolvase
MLTEKQIENKIKHLLATRGAYYFKHFGCKFSKAGVPDLICCLNGKFIGIEVKREDGKLSELQKFNLEQIKKAGGIGIVARSVQEVEECLNSMIIS